MTKAMKTILAAALALGALGPLSSAAFAQEAIDEPFEYDGGVVEELDDGDDAIVVSEGPAEGGGYERCVAEFRSFDPDTGTYTTYDGETLPCP